MESPATSGKPPNRQSLTCPPFCKRQSLEMEMSLIPGCKQLTAARANALKREGGSAHVLGRTRGDPPADTASRRLHATACPEKHPPFLSKGPEGLEQKRSSGSCSEMGNIFLFQWFQGWELEAQEMLWQGDHFPHEINESPIGRGNHLIVRFSATCKGRPGNI